MDHLRELDPDRVAPGIADRCHGAPCPTLAYLDLGEGKRKKGKGKRKGTVDGQFHPVLGGVDRLRGDAPGERGQGVRSLRGHLDKVGERPLLPGGVDGRHAVEVGRRRLHVLVEQHLVVELAQPIGER